MENIYDFDDINLCIKWLSKRKKLNFRRVCNSCSIHPSYFSRALRDLSRFSQLQIFRMTSFFELNRHEAEYFFLLWNLKDSQDKNEKDFFRQKVRVIQNEKSSVSSRIKVPVINPEEQKVRLETYYAEAITALIHMYLTIVEFRKEPELILKRISLTKDKLNSEIHKLEKLGLVTMKNLKIISVQENIHLDEKSSLSYSNHINWRLKAIQNLEQRNESATDYHLSVVFSADEESKHKLRQLLKDTVVKAQQIVGDCKSPKEVYHLMMDLFS